MKKIVKKGKNRLSPAARARIVAAQKRRWAAFYAKKKAKAKKVVAKKAPKAKAPKAAHAAAPAAEKPAEAQG